MNSARFAVSHYRASVDEFVCALDRFTLRRELSRSKRLIPTSSDLDLQTIRTLNRRAPFVGGFGNNQPTVGSAG